MINDFNTFMHFLFVIRRKINFEYSFVEISNITESFLVQPPFRSAVNLRKSLKILSLRLSKLGERTYNRFHFRRTKQVLK